MKFGQIPTCENPLLWGVILFGAFLNVILLFSNAYGESINVNDLANFTILENLSKTTKSHTLLENELDNIKTDQLKEKFVAQIKLIDDKKAVIKVIPISFENSSLKEEFESPKSNLLSSDRNDTWKSANKPDVLPRPPTISYIENEGEQLQAVNYIPKGSDIKASQEEDDDESNRNTSQENTREVYLKKSNFLSKNQLSGDKTIGNSIDNENNKLISQFSELNSSVRSNLQIPSVEANSKLEDRKPIANAGLDQVIMSDQNIVLDASASFDPEGKMSSYLWKPIENSDDNPNTSNSMIYSFPIPEDLEGNTLEFKLIVMDENGQEDTDTVKFLINEKDEEESEP